MVGAYGTMLAYINLLLYKRLSGVQPSVFMIYREVRGFRSLNLGSERAKVLFGGARFRRDLGKMFSFNSSCCLVLWGSGALGLRALCSAIRLELKVQDAHSARGFRVNHVGS